MYGKNIETLKKENMNLADKIYIFDTTLRDGEQAPGVALTVDEKIQIAQKLDKLGVDKIEAGFPVSSNGERKAAKELNSLGLNATVLGLARSVQKDIDAVLDSGLDYIHTFIGTSPLHRDYKLKMSKEKVIETAVESVEYAKDHGLTVEFSAEDATRTEHDYLFDVYDAVVDAGADFLNVPDTVGVLIPVITRELITNLKERYTTPISVHFHNDFGLATANTLTAIECGANQAHVTINGMGERTGNASLEEFVMALKTRRDIYQADTRIVTTEIMRSSKLLTRITGVKVQPNKAIVGENAFAHEAGIHQDGVLKNKATYEIMTPESIGITEKSLVLGKHSGKAALRDRIKSLGYDITDEELNVAFAKFKDIADKKKQVYDSDIEAIVTKETTQIPRTFRLDRFVINSGNTITAMATVRMLKEDGTKVEEVAQGDGPIDAAFHAIESIVGRRLHLEDYKLQSITEGKDALGDATVALSEEGRERNGKPVITKGRGLSTDVIEASLIAYINAVNKLIYEEKEHGAQA